MSYGKVVSLEEAIARDKAYRADTRPKIKERKGRKRKTGRNPKLTTGPTVEVVLSRTSALAMQRVLTRAELDLDRIKHETHAKGKEVSELWKDDALAVAWLQKQIVRQL